MKCTFSVDDDSFSLEIISVDHLMVCTIKFSFNSKYVNFPLKYNDTQKPIKYSKYFGSRELKTERKQIHK